MRVLLTCLLLLTLIAPGLWAQHVTGVLVSAENAAPVHGAIVVLEDERGVTRVGTLSDAQGRFTLAAPGAGRYRLKAERIGFQSAFSGYLDLVAGGSIEQRLVLVPQAVALQGITVRGGRRCQVRPEAAVETHRVWEEARKALSAVALTTNLRDVRFTIRTYEREVDLLSGRVESERSSERLVVNDYPFRSDPAAEILEKGFVQEAGDKLVYYAPDADMILSDEFLDGHCFSVRREPDRVEMIGLAFEPTPQRRHLRAGVTGVLWLDENTGELRQLEYRYTQLPDLPANSRFGGQLTFERLENGAWIVRDWMIQLPRYKVIRERLMRGFLGMTETGGEVLGMGVRSRASAIGGRVLDGEEHTPVAGAVVYLSGTQHEATTGADGRFHLPEVREGRYLLSAYHPEQQIAGELLPTHEVRVTAGEDTQVELLLPGLATQLATRCEAVGKGRTVVAGRVRDRETGVPLGGARVELRPGDGRGAVLRTLADESGRYHLCNVPRGHSYSARVVFLTHSSPERELRVAREGAGAGAGEQAVRSDFALEVRMPLRLVGRVLDSGSGAPVASARVQLLGSERTALTNAQGRFVIENVPSGEHRVQVSHLAYGSWSEVASVRGAEAVELTIHLGAQAIAIEGVVATARRPAGLEDFHRRMGEQRGGVFFDRSAIQRRGATRVEQMLSEHGFRVEAAGVINPRGMSGFGFCGPTVYIDGVNVTTSTGGAPTPAETRAALQMVTPSILDGMEVYRGASSVPIELGGTGGGCGVIVLWTRRSS